MQKFFPNPNKRFSRLASTGAALATLVVAVLIPDLAFAQAVSMGAMICNVHNSIGPYANLIDAMCWLSGAILIGTGAINLKEHADSPANHPVHRAIAKIAGGAGLMTIPFFASLIVNTLLITPGPGGGAVCTPGAAGGTAANVGLDVLVTNFVNNIEGPIISLVSVGAFVMGLFFVAKGLSRGAKYGTDPRANSATNIITYLVIGGILMALAENFNQIFITIFGDNFNGFDTVQGNAGIVMGWIAVQNLGADPAFGTAIAAALTFFQIIGLLAFFRGWYIVKNAIEGSGQATVAQGFTHIIGGVLAINIYNLLRIFDFTFGTGLI